MYKAVIITEKQKYATHNTDTKAVENAAQINRHFPHQSMWK